MAAQQASPAAHRLNDVVIGVALLVVLAIGAGIAALVASGDHAQTPTITRVSAAARQMQASSAGGDVRVQNRTISLLVPAGWTGSKLPTAIKLVPPDQGGVTGYRSGTFKGPLQQFVRFVDKDLSSSVQNPRLCGKDTAMRVPNGPPGDAYGVCGTLVPQNGQALPIFDYEVVGVENGVAAEVRFVSAARNSALKHLISESQPVFSSVRWKLLG